MKSRSTRIAYLRRMLHRLEGEQTRLNDLLATGELTREGAEIGARQLANDRAKLLAELEILEVDDSRPTV